MLWLALHFPDLSLEAMAGDAGLQPGAPLAVCTAHVIVSACKQARAAGIEHGMRKSSALALLPALQLRERDPGREQEALDRLTDWGLQFTPSACLPDPAPGQGLPPAGLLLEIAPSLQLFGGLDSLVGQVRAGLERLGHQARVAVAPTATGAWLLARHRDGARALGHDVLRQQLDCLPVDLLAAAGPHLETLGSIGIRRLADLDTLPRAGLSRRFGPGLLDELDRARGLRPEVHSWLNAPARFSSRIRLAIRTDRLEPILRAARRLLDGLALWLAQRQAATQEFTIDLRHDDGTDTTVELRLAGPTHDPGRLADVLSERVARLQLQAPVDALTLRCTRILARPDASASLLPSPADARQDLARLLEKLQARLGRERIQRLRLAADHRPEAAWRAAALDHIATDARAGRRRPDPPDRAAEARFLPRPLWFLRDPLRLPEHGDRPFWGSPLALLAGPERIETGWWDQALVQRDYFIAEDARHVLYWIYRERTTSAHASPAWFMQGRFG